MEERKSMRYLFKHPEALSIREQEYNSIGIIKLLHEIQSFDAPQNKIFFEIMKHGVLTASQLSDILFLNESTVNRYLADMLVLGYIGTKVENGVDKYFINTIFDNEKFPSGPIIPLIYQYNLLSDETRVDGFKNAIDIVVKKDDLVADLGAGVGLLSHFASKKSKKIYSIEIEPNILNKGLEILKENKINNIEYIHGDARQISLPEKVDVIICEMCDTAFVSELQVPVINFALDNYLKPGGIIIPYGAKTTMELVQANYVFGESIFRLSHYEAYGSKDSVPLSNEVSYHEICFQRINPEFVKKEVVLTAAADGIVNGIRIKTYVKGAKELGYISPSQWFNPPVVLPLEDIYVKKGQIIKIVIKYPLGKGWMNMQYNIINVT